jgi:REP-associated tyrosine transposase
MSSKTECGASHSWLQPPFRRLPHWNVVGQPLFVTFRLHDSLPANRVFPPERLTTGKAFVTMDRILDTARTGPLYLRQPEIASLVVGALQSGDCQFGRYQLHSFVVMPNHVHVLLTPHVLPSRLLGALKGFTAHEANGILGAADRSGRMKATIISSDPMLSLSAFEHILKTTQ